MNVFLAIVYSIHLIALASWVGVLILLYGIAVPRVLALTPRHFRDEDRATLRRIEVLASRGLRVAVLTLVVTLALEIVVRALSSPQGGLGAASLRLTLFGSRYGSASVARWVLLVLALWVADEMTRATLASGPTPPSVSRYGFHPAWTRDRWLRLSILFAALVVLAMAIGGPYGLSSPLALVEAVHFGATLVWLGGLVTLAVAVPFLISAVEPDGDSRTDRGARVALAALNRFTPVALLSAFLIVVTGLLEGGRRPSGVQGAVILKTVLLLIIVGISVWSAVVLRPRLQGHSARLRRDPSLQGSIRSLMRRIKGGLRVNGILALGALTCTAISGLPPAATTGQATMVGHAGDLTVMLHVSPNRVGENRFDVHLADARGAPVTGAVVQIVPQEAQPQGAQECRLPGAQRRAVPVAPGEYRQTAAIGAGGRWDVRVSIRTTSVMVSALFGLFPASGSASRLPRIFSAHGGQLRGGQLVAGEWRRVGPPLIAHVLIASPNDASTLYEGTSNGVYRSSDGGREWASASGGLPAAAHDIWSLSSLPDRSLLAATGAGLYRSTDGVRWRTIGLTQHALYTVAAHVAGHLILLAGGDGGVYRSDDLGVHWQTVYNARSRIVTSLAWPALRPALLVVAMNPGPEAIVVSEDGGATWQTQTAGLPAAGMMSVAVAPDASTVYAGSMGAGLFASSGPNGIWRSESSGLPGLKAIDAHVGSFVFAGPSGGTLYAATDGGVYVSRDRGGHWALFGSGFACDALVVTNINLVRGAPAVLYAATEGGLYRRSL